MPVDDLLIQTFKVGAGIGIGSGIIMGILVLMLKGLDFKPKWWIRARVAERERYRIQLERERNFVPSEYIFYSSIILFGLIRFKYTFLINLFSKNHFIKEFHQYLHQHNIEGTFDKKKFEYHLTDT
jgi:hypothetical protein